MRTRGGRGTLSLAVDLVRLGGQIGAVGMSPEAPFNPSVAAIKLVVTRKIDVRSLTTHRVPVPKATEVFASLLHREGTKALITPD
jgi:threonine dehydrogenase-like Zn-dependent dehydrogenase